MKENNKDLIRILFAILIPPVGVFLQVGLGFHFWINLVLTLLGYIPGIIHGIYIILTRDNTQIRA
ncbi:MAG: YqaE/Pmp3 family membrane protein [Verrucomicrobiales bacterium]|nr:YqaE/Pmp3 family membrane protein [Verrucomicrobiales bacterium]